MNNEDLPLVLTRTLRSQTARPLSVITNLPILYFSGQHVSELHMHHFHFFQFASARFPRAVFFFFFFFSLAAVAHGIIVFLKKSISYFMNIMYKHNFPNCG